MILVNHPILRAPSLWRAAVNSGMDSITGKVRGAVRSEHAVEGARLPSAVTVLAPFEASPDLVMLLGLDGTIAAANPCAKSVGIRAGSDWSRLWPTETQQEAMAALASARTNCVGTFRATSCAGGPTRWWDVRLTAVAAGPARGQIMGVCRDITDLVVQCAAARQAQLASEQALRIGAERLETLDRAARTPLHALAAATALLMQGQLGEAEARHVSRIGDSLHEFERVLGDVRGGKQPAANGGFSGNHLSGSARANCNAVAFVKPPRTLRGRRVLIVEDNDLAREVLAELLQSAGIEVLEACDGRQALDTLVTREVDAVLMDMQMPVMGGEQATRIIRAGLGLTALPVIALTGNVLEEDRRACAAAGCSDFLPKPVDVNALWATLGRWMPA